LQQSLVTPSISDENKYPMDLRTVLYFPVECASIFANIDRTGTMKYDNIDRTGDESGESENAEWSDKTQLADQISKCGLYSMICEELQFLVLQKRATDATVPENVHLKKCVRTCLRDLEKRGFDAFLPLNDAWSKVVDSVSQESLDFDDSKSNNQLRPAVRLFVLAVLFHTPDIYTKQLLVTLIAKNNHRVFQDECEGKLNLLFKFIVTFVFQSTFWSLCHSWRRLSCGLALLKRVRWKSTNSRYWGSLAMLEEFTAASR
jgi:hypothetical protein